MQNIDAEALHRAQLDAKAQKDDATKATAAQLLAEDAERDRLATERALKEAGA